MFHAQYMLALGHYEQATNELAKAMTMMENNDCVSSFQRICSPGAPHNIRYRSAENDYKGHKCAFK